MQAAIGIQPPQGSSLAFGSSMDIATAFDTNLHELKKRAFMGVALNCHNQQITSGKQ